MADKNFSEVHKHQTKTESLITFGLVAVVLFFLASGVVSYWNIHVLSRDADEGYADSSGRYRSR